jgi:hypothetical protein
MIRKLVVFTITVVCLLCPQVRANQHSVSNVKESIVKHSLELGIDPALALSIAKSESGFRHEARSRHGAVGVFQLMPSTAKRMGLNPYYLSDNIKGGLMYYKKLYTIFGSTELALAAYNAGPTVVKKYKKVPPIGETRRFVSTIMSEYNRQKLKPDPAILKVRNMHANTSSNETVSAIKTLTDLKRVSSENLKPAELKSVEHKRGEKTAAPIPPAILPPQGVV